MGPRQRTTGQVARRERHPDLQKRHGRHLQQAQIRKRPNPHRILHSLHAQGRYEVQVLDSYQNPTYANGSCGALYSQYAPLVNACRPPEQWQSYEIVFHAPKCGADGKISEPGTLTMLHNGVLVQDHVAIKGTTDGSSNANNCETGPLRLQDHWDPKVGDTPVRYRNIWYRPLE
jgi:hypothetical protein